MVAPEGVGAGVDLGKGGLRTEAESDHPAGGPLVQPQGGYHMAGLALVRCV